MSTAAPPPARAHALSSPLKIASWHINSVRARLDIVEKFLTDELPDILCHQDTNVFAGFFPECVFRLLGYINLVLCGQRMPSGYSIHNLLPIETEHRPD